MLTKYAPHIDRVERINDQLAVSTFFSGPSHVIELWEGDVTAELMRDYPNVEAVNAHLREANPQARLVQSRDCGSQGSFDISALQDGVYSVVAIRKLDGYVQTLSSIDATGPLFHRRPYVADHSGLILKPLTVLPPSGSSPWPLLIGEAVLLASAGLIGWGLIRSHRNTLRKTQPKE